MFTIPNTLLSTKNSKTIKGEKFGYTTYIMYLAPHKQNSQGKNLCSHASVGCAKACLFKSGAARFDNVQAGKINKTEFFLADRREFMKQLYNEITGIVRKHKAIVGDKQLSFNGKTLRHKNFAIRLNGTSDIPFENIRYPGGKNIFELFPDVTFYDYTKNHTRFDKVLPNNYQLTFSRSETNHKEMLNILNRGFNVAVVFGVKDELDLPKSYMGYPVINGDESDLRFLDDENVIVGLKYKLMTGKGTAGMNKKMLEENKFIVGAGDLPVQDQSYVGMIAAQKVA
jgi:hypothetical protein